jgi:hypothetical protein
MSLPAEIDAAIARRASAGGRAVHRTQIALAKLVLGHAPPGAIHHLELAERFLVHAASAAELAEAQREIWAHTSSLACGCSLTDSASAQVILNCLARNEAEHTLAALREQATRVLQCGVPEDAVLRALAADGAG